MFLATYLKSLQPVRNIVRPRELPFSPTGSPAISQLKRAPTGRGKDRATYLLSALVGCRECHSHQRSDGTLAEYLGGRPGTGPTVGLFRLGPDLPLSQDEKGFAAFPYPGFAVLYAGNLTKYGVGGPYSGVSEDVLKQAIAGGVSPFPDTDGRPRPLSHVMLWQFYRDMDADDITAVIRFIKQLTYEASYDGPRLIYFGTDWEQMFVQVFGAPPSINDRNIFGK